MTICWFICLLSVKAQSPSPEPTFHSAWAGPGQDFKLGILTYWDETGHQRATIIIAYPNRLHRSSDVFDAAVETTAQPGHFNLLWEPTELQRARVALFESGFYLTEPDTILLSRLVFTGEVQGAIELQVSPTMTIEAFSSHNPYLLPPLFCASDLPWSH
ncbi:hypothetical protein FOL47_002755 [Perkinsus chesapeaki]|uniref:Uncharacterized protein n=1 Tax=Perkinsus chesapeaki TaxID=330153 RepID=A0A7J6N005_PERCH|nr:hypothetical protein FOL47_002755 [Perkinsus chesapeaki]